MTDRELFTQALEALTRIWEDGLENYPVWAHEAAIDALRERLAQPEQEPVACRVCGDERGSWAWQCNHCGAFDESPQPRKPPAQPEQDAVLAEREACAQVCEEEICNCCWDDDARAAAEHLAAAIRARGNI